MTLMKQDAPLIVDTKHSLETWAVFEHQIVLNEGDPPSTILIGASRLLDVYPSDRWQDEQRLGRDIQERRYGPGEDRGDHRGQA